MAISPTAETVFLSTPVVVGGVFTMYVLLCILGNRNLNTRIPVRIMTAVFVALSINSIAWFINIVSASWYQTHAIGYSSQTLCFINAYITATLQYGVMGMLTFVIIDQYVACTLPLRYRSVMTLKKCNRVISAVWSFVCVFEIPLILSLGEEGPMFFQLTGVCYVSFDEDNQTVIFICWSIIEITIVYMVPIYIMVHLSYNSYRVMNHRKRASMFSAKAEQELKELQTRVSKLVERHDKDGHENLKHILSLYAKPMVKTTLILFFVILSFISHSLLRFYKPIKDYFDSSQEAILLTVNSLLITINLGLILCAGRIVGSLQLIILRNRYC